MELDRARTFVMKSLWLILLVIAVVLLVTAESRKDRKPGKKAGVGKGKGGRNKPNKKGEHYVYLICRN